MRETRLSGSEGGVGQTNAPSLPLYLRPQPETIEGTEIFRRPAGTHHGSDTGSGGSARGLATPPANLRSASGALDRDPVFNHTFTAGPGAAAGHFRPPRRS